MDDKAASEYWIVTKAKGLFNWGSKSAKPTTNDDATCSHGGNIKKFNLQDHIDFRKDALNLYLHDLAENFAAMTVRGDPIEMVRMVYAIYASVNSSYLYYDKNEHKWAFKETTEVI